ncbi:MAG: hemolysin family protein [Candidatus Cyclonatronum sp.]|uniref:hemolysin family protein n=1 Tax=Cyclonatronum sp. TaxID=3024185 RepID=UPI0025C054E2|nr:hemolysin family protein [Cyclonatronum sp.]MCC5933040.1 HlyC/CorC family transporter [Balneolales bacterium]MCH8485713.1 hemolysin family protein [Cyclonatronum sp.]
MNELLIILGVLGLSAFFSGSEIGYVAANRLRLEIKSRENTLSAQYISYFVKNPESFLSTTLLGNNVVNVAYATLMTLFLLGPITDTWDYLFGHTPSELSMLIAQTMIASGVILVVGEVIPKSIFRVHADRLIPLVMVPIGITNLLLRPLIFVANAISLRIVRFLNPEANSVEDFFKREDIEMIFRDIASNQQSDMDEDDSEILTNVLELSTKRVKESMIPRTEIVAVEKGSSLEDLLTTFITSGYSKIPVYEGSIDNITGVILAYDLFKQPADITDIIRPVKYVPSSRKATSLLSDFRKENISLAVVLDEYGGTAGLVTSEDLIEEVVGDIQDEYDTDEVIMKKLPGNRFIFSGNLEIEDIEENFPEIGLREDEVEFETIAGFIINDVGRIPKVGEEIRIGRLKFTIVKASHSRIEVVKCEVMN